MGIKANNLKALDANGWNTHDYILYKPKNINDTIEFIENYYSINNSFSIRTDKTYGNIDNLPFILIENSINKDKLTGFIQESIDKNLELLITDGRRHDKYLLANIVISIENETVYIEVSSKNIPLRKMYDYSNELSVLKGSLFDSLSKFKLTGKELSIPIDDLNYVYEYVLKHLDIKDKYIELSLYTKPVGKRAERVVCWQTK